VRREFSKACLGLASPVRARRSRFVQALLFDLVYKNPPPSPRSQNSPLLPSLPKTSTCLPLFPPFCAALVSLISSRSQPYLPLCRPHPPTAANHFSPAANPRRAPWRPYFHLAATARVRILIEPVVDVVSCAEDAFSSLPVRNFHTL
jgi:hypothetical protein